VAASALFASFALASTGALLAGRAGRRAQQLLIGSPMNHDRVLLRLPSTVWRDAGYQPGYSHHFNGASVCPNRKSGAGATTTLGSTALGDAFAYVSESPADRSHTSIFKVALSAARSVQRHADEHRRVALNLGGQHAVGR
jgi:hypothetical protein